MSKLLALQALATTNWRRVALTYGVVSLALDLVAVVGALIWWWLA